MTCNVNIGTSIFAQSLYLHRGCIACCLIGEDNLLFRLRQTAAATCTCIWLSFTSEQVERGAGWPVPLLLNALVHVHLLCKLISTGACVGST
jgi:hypothetical protein